MFNSRLAAQEAATRDTSGSPGPARAAAAVHDAPQEGVDMSAPQDVHHGASSSTRTDAGATGRGVVTLLHVLATLRAARLSEAERRIAAMCSVTRMDPHQSPAAEVISAVGVPSA